MTKGTLYFSLFINLLYGIFQLIAGIYYKSWWFITISIYYLLLFFIKLSLVKSMRIKLSDKLRSEYKKLKEIGVIMLVLNIILIGMITLIIHLNKQISYDGFTIYLIALYDFCLIISAFINVIKFRKNHNPILIASKFVNLTVAMISMISLEVAMTSQFGGKNENFKILMTGCIGFFVCVINTSMSIYMIITAYKKLK